VPSGDLLFLVHVLPSGEILGGCWGFEFFRVHVLRGGGVQQRHGGGAVHALSCGYELCIGE